MSKKEDLEIKKAPEELTEQDLEKVNGGFECDPVVITEYIDPCTSQCVLEGIECPPIHFPPPCSTE